MSLSSWMFNAMCKKGDTKRDEGLTTPEDIVRSDNLAYGFDPVWNILDVYRPKDAEGQLPVIIDVHGGGWVYGNKEVYQFYCMELAQHGFAVVNYTYRLAPKHPFPAAIQDLDAVVRYVFAHAGEHGFDAGHVFLVGDSAGAHLSSMYACACGDADYAAKLGILPPQGFMPTALALNCGVYDIGPMVGRTSGGFLGFLGSLLYDALGTKHPTPEQVDLMSPVRHVSDAFPPAFVMSATGDFMLGQLDCILPVLDAHGIEYVSKIYGDEQNKLGHVFHCNLRLPEAHACNDEEMAFLKRFC